MKAAYADGRRAYGLAGKDSSPENFHEWRKRAKDLWYQMILLRRIWPEQLEAIASQLEMLSEKLGDHHDLVMLREAVLKRCAEETHAREMETLHALIDQRERELRAESLAIGARFYEEKPAAFCNRLAGYWTIWRREKRAAVHLS